jgi:hypothetical protein
MTVFCHMTSKYDIIQFVQSRCLKKCLDLSNDAFDFGYIFFKCQNQKCDLKNLLYKYWESSVFLGQKMGILWQLGLYTAFYIPKRNVISLQGYDGQILCSSLYYLGEYHSRLRLATTFRFDFSSLGTGWPLGTQGLRHSVARHSVTRHSVA